MAVTKLIPILVYENKLSEAEHLAKASQLQYEAFGLWQYSAYLAPMQLAVSMRDTSKTVTVIGKMLESTVTAWDFSACPLYLHQSLKEGSDNMGRNFLPMLLSDLESNPEYSFLWQVPQFGELIAKYKEKVNSK